MTFAEMIAGNRERLGLSKQEFADKCGVSIELLSYIEDPKRNEERLIHQCAEALSMKVEVFTPDEFLGDIIGQLNARRGEILGMEHRQGNTQAVQAKVPLAEMFGYATILRSATQGRGIFNMEFDYYARVDESVARAIIFGQ